MRAAVYYGREDVRLEEVPEPVAQRGEIKLRVHFNGLCGSDLHEYYHGPITTRTTPHALTGVCNPVILGHELCGEVVQLGEDIEDLQQGDLIAVEPVQTCGHCLYCESGAYNHCGLLAFHGYNRSGGGLSEYTVVRRSMAHKLPPGMSSQQGALIEPMAISHTTANRCKAEAGQVVAIHGGGPIGIGAYFILKRRGVQVIMSEPSPMRRAVLAKLGVQHILDPTQVDVVSAIRDLTRGHGADASIDAAGVPTAVSAALLSTRIGGQFVVVAIHTQPVLLDPMQLLMSEVQISGIALSRNQFPATIAAMAAGTFPLEHWTSTIPLAGLISDGFEALHRQQLMKVLVAP